MIYKQFIIVFITNYEKEFCYVCRLQSKHRSVILQIIEITGSIRDACAHKMGKSKTVLILQMLVVVADGSYGWMICRVH